MDQTQIKENIYLQMQNSCQLVCHMASQLGAEISLQELDNLERMIQLKLVTLFKRSTTQDLEGLFNWINTQAPQKTWEILICNNIKERISKKLTCDKIIRMTGLAPPLVQVIFEYKGS